MPLPLKILERLRYGKEVAVEVAAAEPNMRAFVVVIPQVPDKWEHPDAYLYRGENAPRGGLRDPSLITGYEIRWLQHDAKYTDEAWGFDYDYVLDDKTTRVKRFFVEREEDIEEALTPWVKDTSFLSNPDDFDSSLVNSPITTYLNEPEERLHLWQEE
jgi:hypothetical protein